MCHLSTSVDGTSRIGASRVECGYGLDWVLSRREINPRKVSGVPIPLRAGTRVQADAIVENYESGSPMEEIAENFAIPASVVEEILSFAASRQHVSR